MQFSTTTKSPSLVILPPGVDCGSAYVGVCYLRFILAYSNVVSEWLKVFFTFVILYVAVVYCRWLQMKLRFLWMVSLAFLVDLMKAAFVIVPSPEVMFILYIV